MSFDNKQTRTVAGKVQVGERAPDFTLPDQKGKDVRLSDLLGKKNIVLYFYPKDDWTPVKIGVYMISIRGWICSRLLFRRMGDSRKKRFSSSRWMTIGYTSSVRAWSVPPWT